MNDTEILGEYTNAAMEAHIDEDAHGLLTFSEGGWFVFTYVALDPSRSLAVPLSLSASVSFDSHSPFCHFSCVRTCARAHAPPRPPAHCTTCNTHEASTPCMCTHPHPQAAPTHSPKHSPTHPQTQKKHRSDLFLDGRVDYYSCGSANGTMFYVAKNWDNETVSTVANVYQQPSMYRSILCLIWSFLCCPLDLLSVNSCL